MNKLVIVVAWIARTSLHLQLRETSDALQPPIKGESLNIVPWNKTNWIQWCYAITIQINSFIVWRICCQLPHQDRRDISSHLFSTSNVERIYLVLCLFFLV